MGVFQSVISKYDYAPHKNSGLKSNIQKQPLRGVLKKRCSENMQQIYRRISIPTFDFNKVAKQFY